jgi:cell division protein ZapA
MAQTLEAPQADHKTDHQTAPAPENLSIAVDIYDQVYHLRGTDPAYIERLASLAALNIADELCTARQRHDQLANLAGTMQNSQQSVRSRAGFIGHLLDEVLEDRKAG